MKTQNLNTFPSNRTAPFDTGKVTNQRIKLIISLWVVSVISVHTVGSARNCYNSIRAAMSFFSLLKYTWRRIVQWWLCALICYSCTLSSVSRVRCGEKRQLFFSCFFLFMIFMCFPFIHISSTQRNIILYGIAFCLLMLPHNLHNINVHIVRMKEKEKQRKQIKDRSNNKW